MTDTSDQEHSGLKECKNSGSDIEILSEEFSDCNLDKNQVYPPKEKEKINESAHISETSSSLKSEVQHKDPVNNGRGANNEIMYSSYREISSDNDSEYDVTVQEDDNRTEDETSTASSLSQISPSHRVQYQESDDTSDYTNELVTSPFHKPAKSNNTTNAMKFKSTASDTEKLLSGEEEEDGNSEKEDPKRPGSLRLPKPLQYYERQHHKTHRRDASDVSNVSASSSTDALIEEASKTPLHMQGRVTREGDMIAFVADGLNDMIKMSSPLSKTSGSMSGSVQSPLSVSSDSAASDVTSSASEWSRDYSRMSRSPSILTGSPDDIPPVDPRAVMDVEAHAVKVATSLDTMLNTMQNNLGKMSALSYHCLDAYRDGVDNTCNSVDTSIKAMYAMMAKCEELSKSMEPTYKLHGQIQDIQRLLDKFENQMAREDK